MKNDIATLHSVLTAWKICSRLRAERRRLLAHTYGRQWEDLVKTSDGSFVTEREKAERAGMKPLTNNLLRALLWRSWPKSGATISLTSLTAVSLRSSLFLAVRFRRLSANAGRVRNSVYGSTM